MQARFDWLGKEPMDVMNLEVLYIKSGNFLAS
jgi:hypothetical protein